MSIAPNRWTARGIWVTGGVVFGAALVTIGLELLDVVGIAVGVLLYTGAVALRRWSQ